MNENIKSSQLKCRKKQPNKKEQKSENILYEIQNEQLNLKENINNYYKVIMKNFNKLQEYNEIADMTNTIFEDRISRIELILEEINKKIV